MPVPLKYRKTKQQTFTGIDFYDVNQGVGYKKFYGVKSGSTAKLSPQQIESETLSIADTTAAAPGGFILPANWDIDWDLAINKITTVKGDLIVSLPCDKGARSQLRNDVYVIKVDAAAAETVLVSASGALTSKDTLVSSSDRMVTTLTVPKTTLKPGEKLRINTQTFHAYDTAPAIDVIWCDGMGRGNTTNAQDDPNGSNTVYSWYNSTDLKFLVPFIVNL